MRKIVSISMLAACVFLSGCSMNSASDKISIVATSFPEYDWVRQVIGDTQSNVELTLLIDTGVDIHNYEPTAEDILKISSADIFIHTGGESDEWVEDVLKQATNESMIVINLVDSLGDNVIDTNHVDVYAHTNEEDVYHDTDDAHEHAGEHDHDEADEHDHDEADEHDHDDDSNEHADEHVWLSLKNAIEYCKIITEKLSVIDAANKKQYEENSEAYIDSIKELDVQYETAVEQAPKDTVVITDRFPFIYLMRDYGINYYAAFEGCSAETEASFETVTFFADKIVELDIDAVLVLENGLYELAATIIASANDKKNVYGEITTLELDSMQSVSAEDIENGETYLGIMEQNLEILEVALSE